MNDRQGDIKRILIAVQPFEQRIPMATANASLLAQSLNAEIALLSCLSGSVKSVAIAADPAEVTPSQPEAVDEAQAALERLAQALRDDGVTVTTRVSAESPAYRGILSEAENWQADLLVIGQHEAKLLPPVELADNEHQLMRRCPCPLLLVRDPNVESYRSILAAVDPLRRHEEPAGLDEAVLRSANELSRALRAQLCVANVYPNPQDFEVVSAVQVEPGVFYGSENIEAAHRQAVDDLLSACGITGAVKVLQPGDPADVILEVASERAVDLIVLGSIKRGYIEEAILGSTAESVAASAACDVLLVKPPIG